MPGRIEQYLLDKIKADGSIHMTLIDPEKVTARGAAHVAENATNSGTAAIMIGGSTVASQQHLDDVVEAIKAAVDTPTILFPGNVTGISRHADAIWFMSMLNSTDPYFLMGAQILGAPYIKKFGIEPLSMGYVIVGDGGAAGRVGKAIPVPYSNPQLAADHALAGQYLGMRFIYLEGGSGVSTPVPPEMICKVKGTINVPLIVGGGIRSKEAALAAANAGADIIVTGNLTESAEGKERISQIITAIKHKP
ncbi:MAG: geranylgeranylglyceryl/heptaprenylglyceryl phosphate synthase [Candidatus Bathyarchaeia archaeon]|jgi:phosphoglycerol geranylgeranyltransferase